MYAHLILLLQSLLLQRSRALHDADHFQLSPSPSRINIKIHLRLLSLRNVVLLLKQVALNLAVLQLLEIPLCPSSQSVSFKRPLQSLQEQLSLTSQVSALLQMVHTLAVIAFAHLLADQSRHHALHPLLPDDRVLCGLEGFVVVVVYAIECWRNGWL